MIIPYPERVFNEEVLRKIETFIQIMKKRLLKFLSNIMWKDGLENVAHTRHIESKMDKEKGSIAT